MLSTLSLGVRCCARRLARPGRGAGLRGLRVGAGRAGEQQHGVTKEAPLPPGATRSDASAVGPVPDQDRAPLAAGAGPGAVYRWRVEHRDLAPDPHQAEVADTFQQLAARLPGYRPARPSFLASLLPGPASRRWAGSPAASRVPRGVYLWGTVGGGKAQCSDTADGC